MRTVEGKYVKAERLGTSYYGNPYYRIEIDEGNSRWGNGYRTSIDSSVNYEATNPKHGDRVKVWLTKAGRIYKMERL